ncbi:MAG: hypothetical protein ACYDD1_18770 [Caulobacteraceae bacterium]
MPERPILFSAPMVQALLAGRKTQTRRVIKLQTGETFDEQALVGAIQEWRPVYDSVAGAVVGKKAVAVRCPYGVPGDRLWVRETFQLEPSGFGPVRALYKADDGERALDFTGDAERIAHAERLWTEPDVWRPSIHMPCWASRLALEVTDVRVERLHDISEADALAEGIKHWGDGFHWEANSGWPGEPKSMESARLIGVTAKRAYEALWAEINGYESLDANPWVWAVSFKVLDQALLVAAE